MHADFNSKRAVDAQGLARTWDRRVNAFLYYEPDWRQSLGGHLELWDRNMTRCAQSIAPLFNRLVVFTSTSRAFI